MRVFDEARQQRGEKVFLLAWAAGEAEMARVEGEMEELVELATTAGALVVGSEIQRRAYIDPALFFGRGKAEEIRTLHSELDFGLVITNDELSPRQQRNLEDALGVPIVDRAGLILDIFAQHARSREGRIQVEAAQLRHLLPRLTGSQSRSRLGGGIGTRGPGEQQLETDRRRIRTRLRALDRDLGQVRDSRALRRAGRKRRPFQTIALVGYTNAGKSSLLNSLTAGGARSENQMFATLDPTTRAVDLGVGPVTLLVDTVGFIQKLPTELVTAFRATLEEVAEADLLLHVLDASRSGAMARLDTVHTTLDELGISGTPMVLAVNKLDLCSAEARLRLSMYSSERYQGVGLVSARTGEGLPELRRVLSRALSSGWVPAQAVFPYQERSAVDLWRRYGVVDSEEFTADGIRVTGRVPDGLWGQISQRQARP